MTVFIHEPDADNEPTIWLLTDGDTDHYRYTALMRRVDLGPTNAHLWPDVVARMTGTSTNKPLSAEQHEMRGSWPEPAKDGIRFVIEAQREDIAQLRHLLDSAMAENEQLRMTGTTITRDALSALCLSFMKPPEYSGGSWTLNPDALADAIIAALTGVPHD